MDLYLTDKVIIITGASKGIGLATAKAFEAEGAKIVIIDIDRAGERQVNDNILFKYCDITNENDVKNAIDWVINTCGKIDVLVNNAAVFHFAPAETTTDEMLNAMLSVNIKSYFFMAKYTLPHLRKTTHPVIVNLSSGVAFQYQAGMAAYSTTKTAILGFTRSLAVDYAPWLRAVSVCPGATLTPSLQRDIDARLGAEKDKFVKATESISLLNRLGKSEEVADFITFIASPRAGFCTGHAFRIDGGVGIRIDGDK